MYRVVFLMMSVKYLQLIVLSTFAIGSQYIFSATGPNESVNFSVHSLVRLMFSD
jgi:hypothetical protein